MSISTVAEKISKILDAAQPIKDQLAAQKKIITDKLQKLPEGQRIVEHGNRKYELVKTKTPMNKKLVLEAIDNFNRNNEHGIIPGEFVDFLDQFQIEKNNSKPNKQSLRINKKK